MAAFSSGRGRPRSCSPGEAGPMALGHTPPLNLFVFFSSDCSQQTSPGRLQCCGSRGKLREPNGCYRSSTRDQRLCLSFTWICFAHGKILHLETILGRKKESQPQAWLQGRFCRTTHLPLLLCSDRAVSLGHFCKSGLKSQNGKFKQWAWLTAVQL